MKMPNKRGQSYRIIGMLFFSLAFINFASAQNYDIDLLKKINPSNPSSEYWKITSTSVYWVPASGIFTSLIAGTLSHNKKLQQKSYRAILSIGNSTLASTIIKISVNRTRPAYAYPMDIYTGKNKGISKYSFPSGHACLAFTSATVIALEYKKWYIVLPAYLWAGSVAYSRMYLGKHYPSDVLAGAALGTASTLLTYKLSKKLFNKKRKT